MENNKKSTGVSEIKILEILKEAFLLFKENFKVYVQFALILFLMNFTISTISYIENVVTYPIILMLLSVLSFVIIFPHIYYSARVQISLYMCIAKHHKKQKSDFKSSYDRSESKFWTYLGVQILLAFIIALPIIGGIIAFFFTQNVFIKWTSITIFAIPVVYLGAIYGFAPLISVLEEGKRKYFKASKKLVEGNIWRVMLLTLIIHVLFSTPYYLYSYVFNDYRTIPHLDKYIVTTINQIASIFIIPFTSTILIVLYNRLRKSKTI